MILLEPVYYTVTKIDGDYAHMCSDDGVENTVAMALLPLELSEGCRLLWQAFTYTIVE